MVLVADRNGTVHVTGIARSGKIAVLSSKFLIPSSQTGKNQVIAFVTKLDPEGEFVLGGMQWIKKLAVKIA